MSIPGASIIIPAKSSLFDTASYVQLITVVDSICPDVDTASLSTLLTQLNFYDSNLN